MVVAPPLIAILFVLGLCCWVAGNRQVNRIIRGQKDPLDAAHLSRRTRRAIYGSVGSRRLPDDATLRPYSVAWARWESTVGAQTFPWVQITGLSLILIPSGVWVIPAVVVPVLTIQGVLVVGLVSTILFGLRGIRSSRYLVQLIDSGELDPEAPEVKSLV